MLGIIGKKLGMTQIFTKDGEMIPVTAVLAGPCIVVQKKTEEKEKYCALQLGFDDKRAKNTTKPLQGHFKKAKTAPKRILHEFRINKEELDSYKLGQDITFDTLFKSGDIIDTTGTSKGRGFTGVMKRHGFKGGKMSHGVHEYHRHGGSIGQASYPGRTFPGIKMPGQHGNSQVTAQNLEIVQTNKEENVMFIRGAVPGAPGNYVIINKAVKVKAAKKH